MPSDPLFPEAVFFDWDGTLADTYQFLNDAHNHLLVKLGLPPMAEGAYKHYFGMPREILYPQIYGGKSEDAKKLFEAYVYDNAHLIREITGAGALLAYLKAQGVTMGVVSNKKGAFITREIENFGWGGLFSVFVGAGEAAADKPSGAPLLLALQRLGLEPAPHDIWYVGDTENDLKCAEEAGCTAVYMRGHEPPEPLIARYNPLYFVENCAGLQEILVAIREKTAKKAIK